VNEFPDPPEVVTDAQRLRGEVEAALAAIVESSDDAIVSKTLDGIIRTWNAGAQRIFGYTPEEIIGKPVTMLLPPDRFDEEIQILARLRRGERVDHFETIRRTRDGRLIDVSVTISPVRDARGVIVGASKIARDITHQKQVQRELLAAKEAAEAAGRAKDRFLSVLSHELRTPLTPVLASLSFLEARGDLPRDLRVELGMMRRNVETQARLVDDLLDLARISRGKAELSVEVLDLNSAITAATHMVHTESEYRSVRLSVLSQAAKHHVRVDPARLQQVLLNLLSNALKFTPAGGSVMIRTSNPTPEKIRLEITDTGCGIEPEILPRLFTPFEQGERTVTRQFGGLGLGLWLSRSLVEMHGGSIRASSPGKDRGTTLTVELPAVTADVPEKNTIAGPASDAAVNAVNPRVLLVEDHVDTRLVMSRLLTNIGCTVASASTVAEALALADREQFDVLISDIGLPDGTGGDVMRGLRARDSHVRGVALSGFGQPDDLRRSEEAGFEQHLVKPINFHALRDVLWKLSGSARRARWLATRGRGYTSRHA
jgi:two-component system CheB/CheR fusion protein